MGPVNFTLLQKHVIHGQRIICSPRTPRRLSVWIPLLTSVDILLFKHTYPMEHSHLKYARPLQTPNPEIPT